MLSHIRIHRIAVLVAVFVGLLAVWPQIAFIFELGDEYRGIYMSLTANEEAYLAIMQEIVDGHPLAASVPFFEYKDVLPLIPPTIFMLYVAFSKLFGVSLVTTLIISKFFLPAILFFLVYLLIYKLGGELIGRRNKFNAIAGGLLVVLGFEFVDYHTIWNFIIGQGSQGGFLGWTRPVNPISGAILIFIFLICLWELITNKNKRVIIPASISLALMMASYVFSWTLALAVMGVLGVISIMKRQVKTVLSLFSIFSLGAVLASPYWFMVWKASTLPNYSEAAARIGMIFTHAPVLNKFLIFILLIFGTAYFLAFCKRGRGASSSAKEAAGKQIPEWWWFCLSLLLGGFIAYNQQVLTGRSIWYYHYVFYTIPFGYVVFMMVLWYFLRPKFPRIWLGCVSIITIASLSLGIYTQFIPYKNHFQTFKDMQQYADIADFFNTKADKDCVVLINNNESWWQNFIPAFTHCNLYVSGEVYLIAPKDRFYHNYLTFLRIKGVAAEDIDAYLENNRSEAAGFLFYQSQYTQGLPDPEFEALFKRLPGDYREFMKRDFRKELEQYRIDYILSVGPLDKKVVQSLPNLEKVFEKGDITVYLYMNEF